MSSIEPRRFLFLQGPPPGPLFARLAEALRIEGHQVCRVNLNGGDRYDWPGEAVEYRGKFAEWGAFVEALVDEQNISDLLLFGDCRPHHVVAHHLAADRDVRIHVLEEGYLRPDWMTLEADGVNARSRLSRDKEWFRAEAKRLPTEVTHKPITASFRRRARDSYWYYHHVFTGKLRFPHYQSHRPRPILLEGLGWLWKLLWRHRRERAAERELRQVEGKRFFVFPLQLSGDYQIRAHSQFAHMEAAARYVVEDFAAHAPGDTHLLVKAHPLDCRFTSWGGFVKREARRLAIAGRLHFVDGGDLVEIACRAQGMVCVNSTSATLSLANATPVFAVGQAIYNLPGLTHQPPLDRFWSAPQPPEPGLFEAFRRVLVNQCLVRGGLASESAVTVLVASMRDRLLR